MKVTVIGHWGGFPGEGGASSGYLLQHDNFNLLIDCGSAVLSKLQKYISVEDLNGVIISHYHFDHTADIGILQYAELIKTKMGITSKTLPIYGHIYDEQEFKRLSLESYTKGIPYKESDILKIGPFEVTFCETRHPAKCFAMRISCGKYVVVYTSDTGYFPGLPEFANDADLLICECNLYKNQDGSASGHLNSTDAAVVARDAGVKHLLLTHLPHYGNISELLEDAKKVYGGKSELASSGWTWEKL